MQNSQQNKIARTDKEKSIVLNVISKENYFVQLPDKHHNSN